MKLGPQLHFSILVLIIIEKVGLINMNCEMFYILLIRRVAQCFISWEFHRKPDAVLISITFGVLSERLSPLLPFFKADNY